MKLKKNIRILKEPYISIPQYWMINIEDGDVYKISEEIYKILASNKIDRIDLDVATTEYLIELGIIENV